MSTNKIPEARMALKKKVIKKQKTKKQKTKITEEFREEESEINELLELNKVLTPEVLDSEELSIKFFTSSIDEEVEAKDGDDESSGNSGHTFSSTVVKFSDPQKIVPWTPKTISFNDNLLTLVEPIEPVKATTWFQDLKSKVMSTYSSEQKPLESSEPEYFHFNKKTFELTKDPPNKSLFKISLNTCKFTTHPLQSEEHKLASELDGLVDQYLEKQNSRFLLKLNLEINTLRDLVKSEANQHFLTQLREVKKSLHAEEKLRKDLLKEILDKWVALKHLRKTQNFHYTTLKLHIKVKEVNEKEATLLYNERFESELREMYQEALEEYYVEKKTSRVKVHKPKIQTIKHQLEEIFKESQQSLKEPRIEVFKGKIFEAPKTIKNSKRYFLKVYFNKRFVGATQSIWMNSLFSLEVNENFGILLFDKKPEVIKISLYEEENLSNIKVATVLVPVPDHLSLDSNETISFASPNESITGLLNISLDYKCPKDKHFIPSAPFKDIEKRKTNEDDSNEDLNFCGEEEIEDNLRFNLLIARHKKEQTVKDKKFIPSTEFEIEENNDDMAVLEKGDLDPIDILKYKGKKFLKTLYKELEEHCEEVCRYSSEHWLMGNEPFTFRSFFSSVVSLFYQDERKVEEPLPLKHTTKEFQNFKITMNIVKATGIPNRLLQTNLYDRSGSNASSYFLAQNIKTSNVKPFLSVSYKKNISRSTTADGSNPMWNETLDLEVVDSPVDLKDDIKIEIFDEYVENLINEDYSRSMEVYQRIYANWLGEYRLPIATLFKHKMVQGVFEINIPKLLVGYTTYTDHVEIPVDSSLDATSSCLLWFTMSITPTIAIPESNIFCLECSESEDLRKHIRRWSAEVKQLYPKRFVDPLICTEEGKRICITRILESIPLPIDVAENLLTISKRFVSLITLVKPTFNPMSGFEGVWLNNQRILEGNICSPKDLGILLACYFMNIGLNCWIVLGLGYPQYEVAYILFKSQVNNIYYNLIDPCSGKVYSTNDVLCPLLQIKSVFDQTNFYCNVQRETRIAFTSFEFSDSSCWLPLFSRRGYAPRGGFHENDYAYRDPLKTTDIQTNIERKIMKKINAWRSMRKTTWNKGFHSSMFNILRNLEADTTYDLPPENYLERLQSDFPGFKIYGFTLNFPYSNLSEISDRIRSTGIHLNMHKEVEFATAVYIHSYPNDIMSVWVFLLSAIPYRKD